jgi:hypothetical protein
MHVFVISFLQATNMGADILFCKPSSSPNLFPSIWTTSDRSVSLHHPNYDLIITIRSLSGTFENACA